MMSSNGYVCIYIYTFIIWSLPTKTQYGNFKRKLGWDIYIYDNNKTLSVESWFYALITQTYKL